MPTCATLRLPQTRIANLVILVHSCAMKARTNFLPRHDGAVACHEVLPGDLSPHKNRSSHCTSDVTTYPYPQLETKIFSTDCAKRFGIIQKHSLGQAFFVYYNDRHLNSGIGHMATYNEQFGQAQATRDPLQDFMNMIKIATSHQFKKLPRLSQAHARRIFYQSAIRQNEKNRENLNLCRKSVFQDTEKSLTYSA